MADRVVLTIGTKKGVFVAEGAKTRNSFALRGPFGPGVPVYATLIDTRGRPRLYASSCNPFFGMKVLRSTNMGKSFGASSKRLARSAGDKPARATAGGPVAWMAGRREIDDLKPIDEAIVRMVSESPGRSASERRRSLENPNTEGRTPQN